LNVGTAWFNFLQSRQIVARSTAEAAATELDTFLRICLAYSELLRAQARRAVTQQNRENVGEIVRLTAAYAAAGQGRQADADRAAVELKRLDIDFTRSERQMLAASARLCQLLSLDPSTRLKAIDNFVVPAPIVPDPVPLSELIAIALMNRPELAARRAEIRQAMYALSAAKMLPFSPNVILGFSQGGFGGGSNLLGTAALPGSEFSNLNPRSDFDVAACWTLQNLGVGNLALIRGAQSRTKQSELREIETLNRIRAEVAEAEAYVRARHVQIYTAEAAVKASDQAYKEDLARIKGREGLPIEVIDSARLLSRSRNEYLDAIVDYNRAQFQLYAAIGRPPADALARPAPADAVAPSKAKQ
jgi:outer membrane protein TolC